MNFIFSKTWWRKEEERQKEGWWRYLPPHRCQDLDDQIPIDCRPFLFGQESSHHLQNSSSFVRFYCHQKIVPG